MLKIKTAEFITSAIEPHQYPIIKAQHNHLIPEIAIVGKSNVGKSSLINHLVGQKGLAKTSSVPGKTSSLNFFLINKEFFLVDLPGYGFAKTSKKEQELWENSIETYFKERPSIKGLIFLVDSRHEPGKNDLILKSWIEHHHLASIVVFTKTDKLNQQELTKQKKVLSHSFQDLDCSQIFYSIKESQPKNQLLTSIQELLDR